MRFPSIVLWFVPLLLAASAAFGTDFTRAEVEVFARSRAREPTAELRGPLAGRIRPARTRSP